jgi:hypothetical protein
MGKFATLTPLAIVLITSCIAGSRNTTVALKSNESIPAARGEIRVSEGDSQNTHLMFDVEHLAPPSRVANDATVYVVWARPADQDAEPTNLGGLVVDDNLRGKLETVTPLRSFDVFITPEPSATVAKPSGDEMLTAHVER